MWRMWLRPTWPELLARPSLNMLDADSSSRRGVSIELLATQTMRAFCRCSLPSLSM